MHYKAPATVQVTLDGGSTWLGSSTAAMLRVTPLVEVAVGRRPYTAEGEGQLIVKVAGPPLLAMGAKVTINSACLPLNVHKPSLVSKAVAIADSVNLVAFPLQSLPATVVDDLTITVAIPGYGIVDYTKNFQRAPPPTNPNITVVVVDHLTRGMLIGRAAAESGSGRGNTGGVRSSSSAPVPPWLPFLAVGWFNSAFTYPAEGKYKASAIAIWVWTTRDATGYGRVALPFFYMMNYYYFPHHRHIYITQWFTPECTFLLTAVPQFQ